MCIRDSYSAWNLQAQGYESLYIRISYRQYKYIPPDVYKRQVQSFANEDIERQKFYKSNHDFLQSKDDNYRCMGSFMSWNLFFQGMMYLTTLVFGGFLISKGLMNVGDLAMYALYIGIFISPIQILVELTEMMQKGLSGFRRFLHVMDTEPEIEDSPDATPLTNVQGHVSYENVSFHYSDCLLYTSIIHVGDPIKRA